MNLPPFPEANPELLKEWHPTKNAGINPNLISAGSEKKVWWKCSRDPPHEWPASVINRARNNRGCPFCAKQYTTREESIAILYPQLLKEWDKEKNKDLDPFTISKSSAKKVWWKCSKGHEWKSFVFSRTTKKYGCPYCGGKRASVSNSLATIHPEIAKEWHPTKNLPLTPELVTRASGKKVWWKCLKCPDHEWQAQVRNRTVVNSGCPECANEDKIKRFQEIFYDTTHQRIDYYRTITESIRLQLELARKYRPAQKNLQQTFFRMLYASAITAMESYLSDVFIHETISNQDKIDKLLLTAPEFKDKKYSLSEIIDWKENTTANVKNYLINIVWHNIPKVERLYKNVLDIDFIEDTDEVIKAIEVRHDLIHRNGKSKLGFLHKFTETDIESVFSLISEVINKIHSQLTTKTSNA